MSGRDEPARLQRALKGMQENLRDTIRRISASSNQLASASEELSCVTSAGTALEEIASAFTLINERNLVIASASEQQAAVAREVDRNLMNVRDLAYQTSRGRIRRVRRARSCRGWRWI